MLILQRKNQSREKGNIFEIFAKKGEAFFRKEEQKIALNCLDSEKSIISLGGGAFINKKIRDKVLSNCVSIWLDLSIKNLSLRLNKNTKRPLFKIIILILSH